MSKSFDVAIDALVSNGAPQPPAHQPVGRAAAPAGLLPLPLRSAQGSNPGPDIKGDSVAAAGKSFFLETFGCQMNDHDSEKVAGVLLGRGYRPWKLPRRPTWSSTTLAVSAKKPRKKSSRASATGKPWPNGKIIGVLGCLAQQEGEEIFERAPWVSLVCGSASYRKLPDLIAQLESGGRRVTGLDLDTDETFETEIHSPR